MTTTRTASALLGAFLLAACSTGAELEGTGDLRDTGPTDTDDPVGEMVVVSPPRCTERFLRFTFPQTTGDWVAVTLSPEGRFEPQSVRYTVPYSGGTNAGYTYSCDPNIDHEVAVWIQGDGLLLGSPPAEFVSPGPGTVDGDDRNVSLDVSGLDLVVEEGQHLVVAFRMNGSWTDNGDGTFDGTLRCFVTCNTLGADTFTSATDGPPFLWTGFPPGADLEVFVDGILYAD